MSKSYIQIMKQIEALKSEAETLRLAEIDGVKARIREAIEFYGLTAADLGLTAARGGKRKTVGAAAGVTPKTRKLRRPRKLSQVAKYRDDVTGGSWVGRGKRPQWLRDALASGKSLDSFLVK